MADLFSLVDLAGQLSNPNILLSYPAPHGGAACSAFSVAPPPRQLQPQRRLTPTEASALVEAYEAGDSVRMVAAAFGIHRTTALNILEAASIERRGNKSKLAGARLQRVVHLYERGLSCATIAEELVVHAETVRRALKKAGVPIRPRRGA